MDIDFSYRSPNFGDRKGKSIDYIVLHYTGMKSAEESLGRLCDLEAQVSCHYLIDEAGTIFSLVDDDKRAWHAGKSYWQGEKDLNSVSLGIELQNLGHEFGYQDFPAAQIRSLCALLKKLRRKYAIKSQNIVAHSDIAPLRKQDPGEKFPWSILEQEGITPPLQALRLDYFEGLLGQLLGRPVSDYPNHTHNNPWQFSMLLQKIGYEIQPTHFWSIRLRAVLVAFGRRFAPHLPLGRPTQALLQEIWFVSQVIGKSKYE